MRFERYVALGDSQTEGLNDPDGRGGFRGWADRFAVLLLATSPHLQYANLAVRGRLMAAIRARVAGYNQRIRTVAAAHGALLVDVAEREVATDLRIWSRDRIHANPFGHSLIAAAFADTLGVAGLDHWRVPLPATAAAGPVRRGAAELRWLGRDVTPWLVRRLRGRSSGDGVSPKRPRLLPVASLFHIVAPADWPIRGDYRPSSLAAHGFVHLSFADQVDGVANARYAGADDLVVVELDPTGLDVEVRVEDSYGSGAAYPHAYGPVPVSAAVAVHSLVRSADGGWRFTRDGAGVVASPGR